MRDAYYFCRKKKRWPVHTLAIKNFIRLSGVAEKLKRHNLHNCHSIYAHIWMHTQIPSTATKAQIVVLVFERVSQSNNYTDTSSDVRSFPTKPN